MRSKWALGVLIGSLALNLALAGFIVGKQSNPRVEYDPTRAFPRWSRTLSEERRHAIRPILREHRLSFKPRARTLRDQHQALRDAISAEPYDSEVLRTVLNQMREEFQQSRALSHESFIAFVNELTPEERVLLARDMARNNHPRHHRRPPPPSP